MLRIDRTAQTLDRLETPSLTDVSITERYDLQEFIFNSPEAFFSEIGQRLFIIGKEVLPSINPELQELYISHAAYKLRSF